MNPFVRLSAGLAILFSMTAITLGTDICKTMDLELSAKYITDNAGIFEGRNVRLFGEVREGKIYSEGVQIYLEGLDEEGMYHISGIYNASENRIKVMEARRDMESRFSFSFLGGLLILYILVRELRG